MKWQRIIILNIPLLIILLSCSASRQYQKAKLSGSPYEYERFLKKNPTSKYSGLARKELAFLYEERSWHRATKINTISKYAQFIEDYPNSKYNNLANQRIKQKEELEAWNVALKYNSVYVYENYISSYPNSQFSMQANQHINNLKEDLNWKPNNKKINELKPLPNNQLLYTKDGVLMGTRQEFIEGCKSGMVTKSQEYNGVEISSENICECVCDKLIPTLTSLEIKYSIENNTFIQLLFSEANLPILLDCYNGNLAFDDNFKVEYDEETQGRSILITGCINEILNDPEYGSLFSHEMAVEYCSCSIDKLFSNGYTYSDILEIENEDSKVFNEIIIECLNNILNINNESTKSNTYIPKDITGSVFKSEVKLIDYLNMGYKVKITIDGITKYYLFDTGASDLLINRDLERELLLNGTLKKKDYLNIEYYTLANNQTVKAQLVRLDNVEIGNYKVNNVICAILDNGSLLCGKGFLDKFRNWEFDEQNKLLILYK